MKPKYEIGQRVSVCAFGLIDKKTRKPAPPIIIPDTIVSGVHIFRAGESVRWNGGVLKAASNAICYQVLDDLRCIFLECNLKPFDEGSDEEDFDDAELKENIVDG